MSIGKMTKAEAGRIGWERTKEKHKERSERFRNEYERNPKLCLGCNAAIPFHNRYGKFCSQTCFAKHNNIGKRRHGNPSPLCLNCGMITKRHGRKFCGTKCQMEYQYKVLVEKWTKGELSGATGKYQESLSAFVKRWLREKNGGECSVCKQNQWMGKPIPLIADHIDGNSRNSRPDNLRLVCGNCDMQLPTYKGRNAGKGRHSRRERYMKGGSY